MNKNNILEIKHFSVSIFEKPVVKAIDLSIVAGKVHVIMGPNGSGKSSFACALVGHPNYIVTQGSAVINGVDVCSLAVHERAQQGLFLAFQNPCEIPGVSVASFLREAYMATKKVHIAVDDFKHMLLTRCEQLGIDESFIARGLNEGFSGGEKKRLEILQLLILQPTVAILDEIDSGLDIDALKVVCAGISIAREENPLLSLLIITHYQRILRYITPDYVHIMHDGRIVASGDSVLVDRLESEGYEAFKHEAQQQR